MNAADRLPRTRKMSVGKGPSPCGRYTSVASWIPSRAATWRSRSTTTDSLTYGLLGLALGSCDPAPWAPVEPPCARPRLAQLLLDDLLGRRLGERLVHLEVPRDREVREAFVAPLPERLGVESPARGQDQACLDLVLAALLVGLDGYDRCPGHDGVRAEHMLDVGGRDVLTSSAHPVRQAIDEAEVAFLVEPARVSGVQPEVAKRLDRTLRHAEVAVGHDPRVLGAD